MTNNVLGPEEKARLAAVHRLGLLDTPAEERFDRITRLAKKAFGVSVAHVSIIDEHRQWFKSAQGLGMSETSRESSICAHTILHDQALVIEDVPQDPRFADKALMQDHGITRFYAGYPVKGPDGSKVGTMCVMDVNKRAFTPEDLQTLRDLASLVEKEFQVVHLSHTQAQLITKLQETERASLLDILTRLWNRRGILEIFSREMAYARRRKTPIGLVMADLDYFKPVNDNAGHLAGDEVLRRLSEVLRASVRPYDAVGRFGGDEFLMILPSCNKVQAAAVAERVRTILGKTAIDFGGHHYNLTMSFGVTAVPPKSTAEVDVFIKEADAALYDAKHAGRNRVAKASPTKASKKPPAKKKKA